MKCIKYPPNCEFIKCTNDKEKFIGRLMMSYVGVGFSRPISYADNLLVNYNIKKPTPWCLNYLELGGSSNNWLVL